MDDRLDLNNVYNRTLIKERRWIDMSVQDKSKYFKRLMDYSLRNLGVSPDRYISILNQFNPVCDIREPFTIIMIKYIFVYMMTICFYPDYVFGDLLSDYISSLVKHHHVEMNSIMKDIMIKHNVDIDTSYEIIYHEDRCRYLRLLFISLFALSNMCRGGHEHNKKIS